MALTLRIDNLKVGANGGAGTWAELNDTYQAYADELGFLIDATRARRGSDKGKVDCIGQQVVIGPMARRGERFVTLEDLKTAELERALTRAKRLINPVTGYSVYDTWLAERDVLQPLTATLPPPFAVQVVRCVGRDCLVSF